MKNIISILLITSVALTPYFIRSEERDMWYYNGVDPSQEIIRARTSNNKVFITEDGTIIYRIFLHPVHYINDDGLFEDISDSCGCSLNWQVLEYYSGYADGLFEETNVCGSNTNYILVNEGYYYRGFVEFNTEAIPDTAVIDSILLNLYCLQWLNPTEDHDIWSMENKPFASAPITIYNDAADGDCYVSNYLGSAGWNGWNLGEQACQTFDSLLLDDWFAIGISGFYSSSTGDLMYQCGTGWLDVIEPPGIEEKNENSKMENGKWKITVYPNPFTTKTVIKLTVNGSQFTGKNGQRSTVNCQLQIYNVSGRLVKSFSLPTAYSLLPTEITWDGRDNEGKRVPMGTYFYQLRIGNKSITKKMILIH